MRGDLLDLILLGAAALFALSGYRQGFVVGVLSFVGFLGGGVIGANLAPTVAKHPPFDGLPRTTVALLTVFLAATLGQVLTTLEIPAALPSILGGLRVGVTLAVVGAIVGEWAGAEKGLGVLINLARGSMFDIPLMFAALLTIALVGIALYVAVVLIERRLVGAR